MWPPGAKQKGKLKQGTIIVTFCALQTLFVVCSAISQGAKGIKKEEIYSTQIRWQSLFQHRFRSPLAKTILKTKQSQMINLHPLSWQFQDMTLLRISLFCKEAIISTWFALFLGAFLITLPNPFFDDRQQASFQGRSPGPADFWLCFFSRSN